MWSIDVDIEALFVPFEDSAGALQNQYKIYNQSQDLWMVAYLLGKLKLEQY